MSLWGNTDGASGNKKPVYANTTNTTASSTINGATANNIGVYGAVFGISDTEAARNNLLANTSVNRVAHAGWVSQKIGTGPIANIAITASGSGYTSGNSLTITDQSGRGQGATATYQTNGSNIANVTITNAGSGYVNVDSLVITAVGAGSGATFAATLGGRAGRIQYETLVAAGSITGDDTKDNTWFGGT